MNLLQDLWQLYKFACITIMSISFGVCLLVAGYAAWAKLCQVRYERAHRQRDFGMGS